MSCLGLCWKYKNRLPAAGVRRYQDERKRCTNCEVFLRWSGTRCPCCNTLLRTRPRNRWGSYDSRTQKTGRP
jgi:hypothetical protein